MPSIAPFLKARQVHNEKRNKARAERRAKAVTMAARTIAESKEFSTWKLADDRMSITNGNRTYSLVDYQAEIDTQVKVICDARAKALAAEKAAAEAAAKTETPVEVPTDTPQA